jgi:acyl carrier protein
MNHEGILKTNTMNDIKDKVAQCFSSVFPNLRAEEIPSASQSSIAAWDSVAQVTLLSAVSEEFGLDFELDDFEQLVSYSLIVDCLESKLGHG